MPESFFRKKYTREEKLKATSETFFDFIQDVGGKNKRFDVKAYMLEKTARKYIYIAVMKFGVKRYFELRKDHPNTEILYLEFTKETFDEIDFGWEDSKLTLFDLNTKLYKKAGTSIEVIFLLIPRDRFALFTMGTDPNIKKAGGT